MIGRPLQIDVLQIAGLLHVVTPRGETHIVALTIARQCIVLGNISTAREYPHRVADLLGTDPQRLGPVTVNVKI